MLAGARQQAQQKRLLLPLGDGLLGIAGTVGSELTDAINPASTQRIWQNALIILSIQAPSSALE